MTREIPLTRGLVALVDETDFASLACFRWHADVCGYAVRRLGHRGRFVRMHRLIVEAQDGEDVDHINGNRADNRRANLRRCLHVQNQRNLGLSTANRSGFKGVAWDASRQRWYASICVAGRTISLGRHTEASVAARAYDRAAAEHFGEFARLNFPRSD